MDVALTVAVTVAAVLLLMAAAYNGLAALRQDVRDAWGDMDAQLRRRYDLLPALASAARVAGGPMPLPLAAALAAKNRAAVAFNPQQLAAAEAAVSTHLRELLGTELSTTPAFAESRAALSAAQVDIDRAGRRYNDAVHSYNVALRSFPHDLVGGLFGFKPQPTFDMPAGPRG